MERRPLLEPFDGDAPGLLVSLPYLRGFREYHAQLYFSDWVLDSGAFSAHASSARATSVTDYIQVAQEMTASDPRLVEVYSLDVIGSWRQTLANTERLWRAGVEAIPCFHHGEPWDVLRGYARDYPKVALGGVAGLLNNKLAWAQTCFDVIWPARVHGFAFAGRRALLALPFESVDASNWFSAALRFGLWSCMEGTPGVRKVSWRGTSQNLRCEVEWHLRLEREARARWAQTWAQIDAQAVA
jgi:hypothetical protein